MHHARLSRGDLVNYSGVAGDANHMDRRVHDFLKREARKDLHKASLAYAAELGVRVRRASIREPAALM